VVGYIPKKGDFVIVNFNPQSGHEQQSRRPAIVISADKFNEKLGLAIVCLITNTDRNIPFHIKVDSDKLTGFVMTEQVKSIDFKARRVQFVEKSKPKTLKKILSIIDSIIGD
jgi:mRNA interferase MazF